MEEKVNYGKGALGGLLFGVIASIPWILIYVFAGYFIVFLGAFIGLGVIYGYKSFVNKIDKKIIPIVSIIIVFIVVVNAMVVIPGLLLIQNGIPFSIENLIFLYSIEGVLPEFLSDLFVSLVFAGLGALPYINSVRLQLKNKNPGEDIQPLFNSNALLADYINKAKEYFVNKSATDSEHAIAIKDDVDINEMALKILKKSKVVIEVDGKYYYDLEKGAKVETTYNNLATRSNSPFTKKYFIIMAILIIVLLALAYFRNLL